MKLRLAGSKTASMALVLGVVAAVALLSMAGCGEKPEPEMEPGERDVPEEEIEQPEETAPPEETGRPDEQPDEEEISLLLKDIRFAYDEYALTSEAKEKLSRNAEVLTGNMWVDVLIEGHCDERGTVEYNLALGEKRALAAKRYLVSYGIDPSRISVISYGKERPLDPRHNEEAWAKNRRAHFVVK